MSEWQYGVIPDAFQSYRYRLGANKHFIDFESCGCGFESDGGALTVSAWQDSDCEWVTDGFPDSPGIAGSVKWDGCMNFHDPSGTMIHICGPNDNWLAALMSEMFVVAERVMTEAGTWDGA